MPSSTSLNLLFRGVADGEFFCPDCGADRPYRLRPARPRLLRLLPMGRDAPRELVECGGCGARHAPKVLDAPTSTELVRMLRGAMSALAVAVLRAGGPAFPAAREAALDQMRALGADDYGDEELDADLFSFPNDVSRVLARLAAHLDPHGREALLARGTRIAVADGPLDHQERASLVSAGLALEMSPAHVRGVIDSVAGEPRDTRPE